MREDSTDVDIDIVFNRGSCPVDIMIRPPFALDDIGSMPSSGKLSFGGPITNSRHQPVHEKDTFPTQPRRVSDFIAP